MIIVIDGPAGAGKSTAARAVSRNVGFDYVDSGAIYRGFTCLYLKCGSRHKDFLKQLDNHQLRFDFHRTEARVFLGDDEITNEIRSGEVNELVSEVAAIPGVRTIVRNILRDVSSGRNVVLEGRDLGTVVFPNADIKFFLTADQKERARRRHEEQLQKGLNTTFDEVLENVEHRDRMDSIRKADPLKKAADAIEIDSTNITFEDLVARISEYIRNRSNTEKSKR